LIPPRTHRAPPLAPRLARAGAALALVLAACSSTGERAPGEGDASADPTATSTATTTSTSTGTGERCDDRGLACGDADDPACQGCAIEGACKATADACFEEPHDDCVALNDCYADCPDGEQACFEACDLQHPEGSDLLLSLLLCIFCDQCPSSCDVDVSACPGG
jgi:hypothetical protein